MKIKKYTALVLLVLTLTIAFMPTTMATSLSRFNRYTSGNSTTRWNYDSSRNHKGSTSINVKYTNYSNDAVLTDFVNNRIPNAITAWNDALPTDAEITVGKSSSSTFIVTGNTNTSLITGYVVDITTASTVDSSGHMNSYTLTLHEPTIGALNSTARNKAAQQVVGFLFGLRRLSGSDVIMSESFHNTNISTSDKRGMYVVTHKHKHNATTVTLPSGSTSSTHYTYSYKSSSEHTISCDYCNTYFTYSHTCQTSQHNEAYHKVSCGKCTNYVAHTFINHVCKYCGYAENIV